MKEKVEVNSWNNYMYFPLPHIHTAGGGGGKGLFDLPGTNYSWMRNYSMGPLNTNNSDCLRQ